MPRHPSHDVDALIPPAIVQAAARKLREGEHLIGEVLAQVLVDLRAAGWIVEPDLLPGKIIRTPNSPGYLFLSWPAEMQPPFFEGVPGAHTLAPWSVKLTPAAIEKSSFPVSTYIRRGDRIGQVIQADRSIDWMHTLTVNVLHVDLINGVTTTKIVATWPTGRTGLFYDTVASHDDPSADRIVKARDWKDFTDFWPDDFASRRVASESEPYAGLPPHTTRDGCWPPDGTPDGSIHILVQRFHDIIVTERAMWHAENSHWTRWLDSRPTGDFAACCLATYVGPEPVVVTPYPGLPKVVLHPDLERRLATEMRPRPADWRPDLRPNGAREEWRPPAGSKCRPMAYVRTAEPSRNARLLDALLESAWQALEHERITGKPPSVPTPPAVGTPIGWPSPL